MQLLEIVKPESAATEDTRPFQRVSIVRRKPVDWDECERGGYRNLGQAEEGFSRFISDEKGTDNDSILDGKQKMLTVTK
ncbi:hypothetical protein [Anabaena azotica]|uniref:CpcD n=1 Tax=Anabaena azotica FACHB-119 TaxID=947527 RepID=A0ABR8DGM2_9NOST|nr:hypothetical protein [Anabaena azotica]MBD2505678.1 hypothetical protein [Anabaena azotica FACHB-119]